MRRVMVLVLVLFWAVPTCAVNIRTGTGGKPGGWCELGWGAGCVVGHAGLTDQGLLLSAALVPPHPAYELTWLGHYSPQNIAFPF